MKKNFFTVLAVAAALALAILSYRLLQRNKDLSKQLEYTGQLYKTSEGIVKQLKAKETTELSSKQQEQSGYKADYLRVLAEKNNLEAQKISQESQINKLTDENKKLSEERAKFNSENGGKDKEIQSLKAETEKTAANLKAANERIAFLESQNKDLSEKKTALDKKETESARSMQSVKRVVTSLRSDVKNKDEEIENLKKQFRNASEMQVRLKNLESELGRQKEKDAAGQKLIGSLKNTIKENENQRRQFLKTIEDLKKENSDLKRREKKIASEDSRKLLVSLKAANRKAEGLEAETAVAHYNLGVLYMRLQQFRDAVEELEYTVKLNPNDALAHYNLALLYDSYLTKPKQAIPHYEAYLRLLPHASDSQEVENRLLHIRLDTTAGSEESIRAELQK